MKLNDKDPEKITETLSKRYRNQQKVAQRNRSEDAFRPSSTPASTYDPHTQYFAQNINQFQHQHVTIAGGIGRFTNR